MDKTYNDLMDIVNRTKKMNGGDDAPRVTRRVRREEPIDEAVDTVRVVKPAKDLGDNSKASLFADKDAISKYLSKSKTAKKTTTKKKAEDKKETKKSTAKTTTTKKTTAKKTPAENKTKTEVESIAPMSNSSTLDMNDPKNIELYNALKGTLFAGGTDISDYVEENKFESTVNTLKSLKEKKKTEIINEEITKEQQEYEKLFTGSFFTEENTQQEEVVDEDQESVYVTPQAEASTRQVVKEKRLDQDLEEIKVRDIEIDRKIADYYKQKQEKINKYNEALYSDSYVDEKKTDSYEDKQHAYEDIFSGPVMSRSELMGEEPAKEEVKEIESVETEIEPNEEVLADDTTIEHENSEAEDTQVEVVEEKDEESTETEEPELTEFQKIYQQLRRSESDESNSIVSPKEDVELESASVETEEATEVEEVIDSEETTDDTEEDVEEESEEVEPEVEKDEILANVAEEVTENNEAEEITEIPQVEENIDEVEEKVEDEEENIFTLKNIVKPAVEEVVEEVVEETTEETVEEGFANEEIVPVIDEEKDIEESKAFVESVEEEMYGDDYSDLDDEELDRIPDKETETPKFEPVVEEVKEEIKKETFTDEDLVRVEQGEFGDEEMDMDNIYDLSQDDELDDYIVSSNVPDEVEQEEDTTTWHEYIEEDNSLVIDSRALPESQIDVLGKAFETKTQEVVEESEEEVPEKEGSDVISKEEFYNEMARLQENLINELKGQKVETESKDFFAEKVKAPEPVQSTSTIDKALDIISNLTNKPAENADAENEDVEPVKSEEDQKAEQLVEDIIENIEKENAIEEIVEKEVYPEDLEKFDSMDLLNKEVALNEEDLEFFNESQKPRDIEKDAYFYMSDEDKTKKAEFEDEYLSLYTEEESGHNVEVGDINLNKDIQNAVPLSELYKNSQKEEVKVNNTEDEMETIYTLFGMERKKMEKAKEDIKVLYVASECQPFIATGGLADVAGSLPKAMAEIGGVDVRVVLPLYGNIKTEYRDKFEYLGNFTVHLSWRQEYCGLFRYVQDGVTYYFIDNERYFKRDKTYGYYDDGERFAYFCKAIVESLPIINFWPDIIHCNDWQTSLVSAYIKTGNWSDFRYYKIKNIYTIHNVEYQGVYGMENLKDLFGIDFRFRNDMDYNGDINLTKAAIQYSDKFTTVSESYCDNLKQPYCSRGLHHIIIRNEYKLSGIINGIDYDFYNPETDKVIYKNYNVDTMKDKVMNKKIWQDELGLPVDARTPMLAIVSRLVSHKGLDLLSKVIEDVLQQDIQLVVVGTGDERFVDYYKYLESKYPTKVRAMVDAFSVELARKAYAASDIFLMPSKIEPCGISQMIASRYGSIPVVREVGGLKDTIKDFGCPEGGNGYTFTNYNPNDLKHQINRAIEEYEDQVNWEKKMKIAMTTDFRWSKSAEKYIDLYKSLV